MNTPYSPVTDTDGPAPDGLPSASNFQGKDFWDKYRIFTTGVAVAVTPFVVGIIGHFVTMNIGSRDNEIKMSELAVEILSAEPEKSTSSLRNWAIDVLDVFSGVPMPEDVRNTLENTALPSLSLRDGESKSCLLPSGDECRVDCEYGFASATCHSTMNICVTSCSLRAGN